MPRTAILFITIMEAVDDCSRVLGSALGVSSSFLFWLLHTLCARNESRVFKHSKYVEMAR